MTRTIKASEFKAKCLKLLDEVSATGDDIVVTKRGKVVARVSREMAKTTKSGPMSLLGCLEGEIEFLDPDDNLKTWDADMQRAHDERLQRTFDAIAPPVRTSRSRKATRG